MLYKNIMILSTIVLGFNACSIAMENKSKYEKELEEMQHNCFMKMKFAAQKELERYRSATEEERKKHHFHVTHDVGPFETYVSEKLNFRTFNSCMLAAFADAMEKALKEKDTAHSKDLIEGLRDRSTIV